MTLNPSLSRFAASNNAAPPSRLGQRYSATKFLPEAGNTVVCHLDITTPQHRAVLKARDRMRALPGADRFLYTPAASLHMTLFDGVIETGRARGDWPADIDLNATVDSVTEALLHRLAHFSPRPEFNVRVVDIHPSGLGIEGATPEDEATMRAWRDALTAPFGFRKDTHDTYRFHMTFAYPVDWLPDALLPQWQRELHAILEDITREAPILPLNAPAFCRFADMTHFKELLVLQP